MQFRFRILDLIVITALIALLVGSFREDLAFFRQLVCVELATLFSATGVLLFSKLDKWTWLTAAICGLLSGLVYLVMTYVFVDLVYDALDYQSNPLVRNSYYSTWFLESGLALLAATSFGSAIGPMLALRFQAVSLPPDFAKSFRISVGILSAILLIAVLRMFDRLVNFGSVRDLGPLVLIAFVVFIVFTNQWLFRFYRHQNQASGPSVADSTISTCVKKTTG